MRAASWVGTILWAQPVTLRQHQHGLVGGVFEGARALYKGKIEGREMGFL